jgi:hypothetical protein
MTGKLVAMSHLNNTTRSSQKRIGMMLMLTVLLVASVIPAHAWYGHRIPHVFIAPRVVMPFWAPYAYPPVVVALPRVYVEPPPSVYIPPPPPPVWYYCDDPPGYYPYVQQCPGGWRQVIPTHQ